MVLEARIERMRRAVPRTSGPSDATHCSEKCKATKAAQSILQRAGEGVLGTAV